jgi:hypothetical protein
MDYESSELNLFVCDSPISLSSPAVGSSSSAAAAVLCWRGEGGLLSERMGGAHWLATAGCQLDVASAEGDISQAAASAVQWQHEAASRGRDRGQDRGRGRAHVLRQAAVSTTAAHCHTRASASFNHGGESPTWHNAQSAARLRLRLGAPPSC